MHQWVFIWKRLNKNFFRYFTLKQTKSLWEIRHREFPFILLCIMYSVNQESLWSDLTDSHDSFDRNQNENHTIPFMTVSYSTCVKYTSKMMMMMLSSVVAFCVPEWSHFVVFSCEADEKVTLCWGLLWTPIH